MESTSEVGNRQNVIARSLEPLLKNTLASKVEKAPRDPILYEEIVSIMTDQAERIQELERNLQHMIGVMEG